MALLLLSGAGATQLSACLRSAGRNNGPLRILPAPRKADVGGTAAIDVSIQDFRRKGANLSQKSRCDSCQDVQAPVYIVLYFLSYRCRVTPTLSRSERGRGGDEG